MTVQKENFYFKMSDGLLHFRCVFCNDTPLAGHSSEREYWPAQCTHPIMKALGWQGRLCSNCYNWDFDILKRNPPRHRYPLKHKSGRLLAKDGTWLGEQHNPLDSFMSSSQ